MNNGARFFSAHRRRSLLLLGTLAAGGITPRFSAAASGPDEGGARVTVMLEDFPPYSFPDPQGRPSGYSVDLAREILTRAGLQANFEFSSWTRVLLRARSEPNVLVPAIVRLPERESQFHWLGQISSRRGMLFRLKSRPDVQPKSLAEARAYRIGVIKDDVAERELVAQGLEIGRQLDRCSDYPALLRRFFGGRAELLALSQQLAPAILQRHGYDPALIEPVLKFSESRPSMALSLHTGEAMQQRVRKAWDSMRRDGSAAAIAARYPAVSFE